MLKNYFILVLGLGYAEILDEPVNATSGLGFGAIGLVLAFLLMFIIQGASEEVAVRGWLLPVLSKHYTVPVAIFLSSLFFGILHLLNPM